MDGHVGHHGDDDVGRRPERRRQRGEEVALPRPRRLLARAQATARSSLSVATIRAPGRAAPESGGDGSRAGAQVDGRAVGRQASARPLGQLEALPAGDVDPGVDDDGVFAEVGVAGDPGQGLARQAPVDQ